MIGTRSQASSSGDLWKVPLDGWSALKLLENVWESTADTTTRTVDNHIASLRAKLEDDPPNPRHLLTVHGVGYKWVQ